MHNPNNNNNNNTTTNTLNSHNLKNCYYYNNNNINSNAITTNNNQNALGNNNNNNMLQPQHQLLQHHQQQQQQQQHVRVSNWVQDTSRTQYLCQQQLLQQQEYLLQQQQQYHNYAQQQQTPPQMSPTATAATTTTISSLPSMNFYANQQQAQHQPPQLSPQIHAQHPTQHRLPCSIQQQQQQNLKTMLPQQTLTSQQQHQQQILTPAHSPVTATSNRQTSLQHPRLQQQHLSQMQQHQHHHQQQQILSQHQRRLVSMECMQTGVPTLTTPTLTPTTLRSIEETFTQLTSEPMNAPYQAGFIPPPLGSYNPTTNSNNNTNNTTNSTTITSVTAPCSGLTTAALNNIYLGDISGGASVNDYGNTNDSGTEENSQESWNNLHEDNSMATTDNSSAATDTISFQNGLGMSHLNNSNSSTTNDFTNSINLAALAVASAVAKMPNSANLNSNTSSTSATTTTTKNTTTTTTRRGGGRRPTTNASLTPEEEEKRRVRRERNKLAAARCRKRRVDQTNELTEEVAVLEKKREELQKQIESLNNTKQELEYILEAHRTSCQINPDVLSVNSLSGLIPATDNSNITGLDTTLSSTARSNSPLDLKPVLNDQLLAQIKPEPLDSTLDSNSSLDGPPSPKKMLLSNNNPMIPPPLPNVATLSASLAAASSSLNTPIVTTPPISFGSVLSSNSNMIKPNSKQRPNSLPTVPRNMAQTLALNMADNKPPTDINGVAIQTPSTGMFNFDSLMDGGTGLTPVSGPLVPTCSSQNKHPLELVTPTSEPSKLVSL